MTSTPQQQKEEESGAQLSREEDKAVSMAFRGLSQEEMVKKTREFEKDIKKQFVALQLLEEQDGELNDTLQ